MRSLMGGRTSTAADRFIDLCIRRHIRCAIYIRWANVANFSTKWCQICGGIRLNSHMLKNMFVFCCRSCCGKGHQHLSYSLPVGHIRRHGPDIALPALFAALLLQVCIYLAQDAQTIIKICWVFGSIIKCSASKCNVFFSFQEEVFALTARPQEVHSILHPRCL